MKKELTLDFCVYEKELREKESHGYWLALNDLCDFLEGRINKIYNRWEEDAAVNYKINIVQRILEKTPSCN